MLAGECVAPALARMACPTSTASALQSVGSARDAFLYAFDLLEIDGEDLRPYEWHVRRATLASLLRRMRGDGIWLSEHIEQADAGMLMDHACAMGLEGIVAKRRDRPSLGALTGHLRETNNSNNLRCQDAAKAHIGAIRVFGAVSKAEAKRHRQQRWRDRDRHGVKVVSDENPCDVIER